MTKHKKVPAHHHEKVKDHAKALVAATSHIADEKISEVRKRLSTLIEDAGEAFDDVQEKAIEKVKAVDDYIHEKPYQVIGVAVGVSLLIGYIWAKRKKT